MFFDTTPNFEQKFAKTQYLRMTPGVHKVRFLSAPTVIFQHYMNRASFKCLGDNCPVCNNNKRIRMENPTGYATAPGYNRPQKRHLINVFDRTVVKVCPKCGEEIVPNLAGVMPPTCTNPSCGVFITDVVAGPSNKVKVLSLSNTTADLLSNQISSKLDPETKTPVSPFTYDINFLVSNNGPKGSTITPMPDFSSTDSVEVPVDDLYDLSTVTLQLTAEEIAMLMTGVSLKDIFAARKSANEFAKADVQEKVGQDIVDSAKSEWNNLFNS